MKQYQSESFKKARKKVNRIKGFYKHLVIYLTGNIFLLFLKIYIFRSLSFADLAGQDFESWVAWNFFSTPIIWGFVLFIHGLIAFQHKLKFLQRWEARQIRKFMEKEDSSLNKFN